MGQQPIPAEIAAAIDEYRAQMRAVAAAKREHASQLEACAATSRRFKEADAALRDAWLKLDAAVVESAGLKRSGGFDGPGELEER